MRSLTPVGFRPASVISVSVGNNDWSKTARCPELTSVCLNFASYSPVRSQPALMASVAARINVTHSRRETLTLSCSKLAGSSSARKRHHACEVGFAQSPPIARLSHGQPFEPKCPVSVPWSSSSGRYPSSNRGGCDWAITSELLRLCDANWTKALSDFLRVQPRYSSAKPPVARRLRQFRETIAA